MLRPGELSGKARKGIAMGLVELLCNQSDCAAKVSALEARKSEVCPLKTRFLEAGFLKMCRPEISLLEIRVS
jgi:hypothetical protein